MTHTSTEGNRQQYGRFLLVLLILSVVLAAWLWWTEVYTAPSRIFSDMLDNSLKTPGVSREVTQTEGEGTLRQIAQGQYGSQNIILLNTSINQTGDSGDTSVTTETIASSTESYVRYTHIETPEKDGKKPDFTPVINQWAKDDATIGDADSSKIFSESVYGGILFGDLPLNLRRELTAKMHRDNIYKVNFADAKLQNENGQKVWVYKVEVQTKPYIELLKRYDEMLGLKLLGSIDPEAYANSEPIKLELHVDKNSRTLSKLMYEDQGREEKYSGYGIQKHVDIPVDAISRAELEEKLQSILYQ